jgi:rhomboid protease GluP
MAFGFPPKYTQEFPLHDIDPEHALLLARQAVLQLKWEPGPLSETGLIAYTKFSMTSWSEKVTVRIHDGTGYITSECTSHQIFDWGKNKRNSTAFLERFEQLRSEFLPAEAGPALEELRQLYVPKEQDPFHLSPSSPENKINDFISVFRPVKGYMVTPLVVLTNILLFVIMVATGVDVMAPDHQSLLQWGANFRPMTLDGEWWRLLTACFLHIGILHLLMNMYALLYIGLLLEPILGSRRFLAAYLLSGVAASLTSLWWHDLTISAGASGAVFGMYGVFISLLSVNLVDQAFKKSLLPSVGFFVIYNILYGLRPGSGIDNAAHIGGLLSGCIIGFAFVPGLKNTGFALFNRSVTGLLVLVLSLSVFLVCRSLPNDIVRYDKEMEKFALMEARALKIYTLPEGTPREQVLSAISDSGLYYWNASLRLLDSFEEMDLPEVIRIRNESLKEYCGLRIKSYEIIYKAFDEDTDRYDPELREYDQKIEQMITKLGGAQ